MESILNAAVYVGTYRKYNEGSIEGKWLHLADYTTKRKFIAACRELHSDEHDPEFMYQDVAAIPESMYSESHISDEVWHIINSLKKFAPDRGDEFAQWCDDNGAEQDYTALREFLNFKPKEAVTNKIGMSGEELKKAIVDNFSDKGWLEYVLKGASSAIYLEDKLVTFYKPAIETSFYFDDENEAELNNYYNFSEGYFINSNMERSEFRFLDDEEKFQSLCIVRLFDRGNLWVVKSLDEFERQSYSEDNCKVLTPEQRQKVKEIILDEKAKFQERLQNYLKRYGLTKIKKQTYWANV